MKVYPSEEELEKLPLIEGDVKCYKMTNLRMNAWSSLETPPGIMAVVEKPAVEFVKKRQSADLMPVTVVLDSLRDPGNMGSLIRAISASGCANIVAMKGCCDPWDSKVMRGAMGAHFSIPIHERLTWDELKDQLPEDFDVYLADSGSFDVINQAESFKLDHPQHNTEYNNNNNNDDDDVTSSLSCDDVTLLSHDDCEKKNVDEEKTLKQHEKATKSTKSATALKRSLSKITKLPVLKHYDVQFWSNHKHVVLIVGGEAEGASDSAYQFVHEHCGHRCHVPMLNNVDSLNVATACGIVVFEMRRQFSQLGTLTNVVAALSEESVAES